MRLRRWMALVVGVVVLGLVGCKSDLLVPDLPEPVQPQIKVHTVGRGDILVLRTLFARCEARERYAVRMPFEGKFTKYKMVTSSNVFAGTVIAEMDTTVIDGKIATAQAAVNSAQAAYDAAVRSGNEGNAIRANITLVEARRDLSALELEKRRCQFIAPIDGLITYNSPDIRPGDTVANDTPLYTITDNNAQVFVYRDNPDYDMNDAWMFLVGETVIVEQGGKTSRGVITQAPSAFADMEDIPNSYRRRVVAEVPNAFMLNVECTISKIITERRDVIVIPKEALHAFEDRYFVYVLDANGLPTQCDVRVGEQDDLMVEIIAGLVEGDQVVVG